jgi:voltage-gated potassium channel
MTDQDPRDALYAKYFEKPLIVAAILTIPATILQNTNVPEPWGTVGSVLNWTIWLAFLAELVVMLAVARDRRAYLRRHPLDLLIVVLTPPFALYFVESFRLVRLLRVLRLIRLAPLARLAFSLKGVQAAAGLAVLTAVAAGGAFAAEEGKSFGDGMYWAAATMATVGYGDLRPHSEEGKVLAILVMLVGIGTASLVIGAVAQRFLAEPIEGVETADDDLLVEVRAVSERLARLEQLLELDGRRRTDDDADAVIPSG